MNQNELKKELQMNLPEPPEGFDARSEAKLAKLMIEEEPQMKKKISVGLVFAIVLALLSLTERVLLTCIDVLGFSAPERM